MGFEASSQRYHTPQNDSCTLTGRTQYAPATVTEQFLVDEMARHAAMLDVAAKGEQASLLRYRTSDFAGALEHFQRVADGMDHSAEKTMALADVAACDAVMRHTEEAVRYYEIVIAEPDVGVGHIPLSTYADWGSLNFDGNTWA